MCQKAADVHQQCISTKHLLAPSSLQHRPIVERLLRAITTRSAPRPEAPACSGKACVCVHVLQHFNLSVRMQCIWAMRKHTFEVQSLHFGSPFPSVQLWKEHQYPICFWQNSTGFGDLTPCSLRFSATLLFSHPLSKSFTKHSAIAWPEQMHPPRIPIPRPVLRLCPSSTYSRSHALLDLTAVGPAAPLLPHRRSLSPCSSCQRRYLYGRQACASRFVLKVHRQWPET